MSTRWDKLKNRLEWVELSRTVADILMGAGVWRGVKAALPYVGALRPEWISPTSLFAGALSIFGLIYWQSKTPKRIFPNPSVQSPINPIVNYPPIPAAADWDKFFLHSYKSILTDEAETRVLATARQKHPQNADEFLAKIIGIGVYAYQHDWTWLTIFKSQLLMLTEINRRGGWISVADAKTFYDKAKVEYPAMYTSYSFESWINYMKERQLLIRHPGESLEITFGGKDLLKYMTHCGRIPESRVG